MLNISVNSLNKNCYSEKKVNNKNNIKKYNDISSCTNVQVNSNKRALPHLSMLVTNFFHLMMAWCSLTLLAFVVPLWKASRCIFSKAAILWLVQSILSCWFCTHKLLFCRLCDEQSVGKLVWKKKSEKKLLKVGNCFKIKREKNNWMKSAIVPGCFSRLRSQDFFIKVLKILWVLFLVLIENPARNF